MTPAAKALEELDREARAYIAAHGHLDVPQAHVTASGYRLGAAIRNARTLRRTGGLGAERFALLDRLGVDWEPRDPRRWLPEARAYARRHGHLRVPQEYVSPTGVALGMRVRSARISHREGSIAPQLKEALDLVDPCWAITYRGPDPDRAGLCAVPRCREAVGGRGLCGRHLEHLHAHGSPVYTVDPPEPACAVPGCAEAPRPAWCAEHGEQVEQGHGRTAYRKRVLACGGRCQVCRADHARAAAQERRAQAEKRLPAGRRRELVAELWGGRPLDEVCEQAGASARELLNFGALPELLEAVDVALMATRDPEVAHGSERGYRQGCRCPECRGAKRLTR